MMQDKADMAPQIQLQRLAGGEVGGSGHNRH